MKLTPELTITAVTLACTMFAHAGVLFVVLGRLAERVNNLDKTVRNGLSSKIEVIDKRIQKQGEHIAAIRARCEARGECD
jgi:hypothetical protein